MRTFNSIVKDCGSILASLVTILVLCPATSIATTRDEQLFRTFTACDRSFFETLAAESSHWSAVMDLTTGGGIAYPKVEDRREERTRWQPLRRPLNVNGVTLIAYYDAKDLSPTATGTLGKRLFWGFLAEGEPAEVVAKLRPHISDGERVAPAKDVDWPAWIRGEWKYANEPLGHWKREEVSLGKDTAPGQVERVLIIEGTESGPGRKPVTGTVVECSLQGDMLPTLLHLNRPDLDDASIENW